MVSGPRWDAASCTGASRSNAATPLRFGWNRRWLSDCIQKGFVSASDRLFSFPHRSEVTEAQCRPSGSQTAARRGSIDGPKDYLEPCTFILPTMVALLRFCTGPSSRW